MCMMMCVEVAATDSIFPRVDELLGQPEYQKALRYVAKGLRMSRYRSMVDFFFAELFGWQRQCFAFYNDEGPSLQEIIREEYCRQCEERMVVALQLALQMRREHQERSWCAFASTASV